MKRLLNRPERQTHVRLQEVCAANGASVFSKVRLADVLPIENSGIPDASFRYALQAHFDFVVTDSEHLPLFAVEFDGPMHSDRVQRRRDQTKDELCERFDLPLLRINDKYLSPRYRGMDLLTWFVEVWFAQRWFHQSQQAGFIPEDEPFTAFSIVSVPGRKNAFPLWLSATVRDEIHKLHFAGRVLDLAPSQLMGWSASGHCHAIAFLRVDQTSGIAVESAMRSKSFPVSEIEALDEIITHSVHDRLCAVLAGEESAEANELVTSRIDAFVTRYPIGRAFHVGGSYPVPNFRFEDGVSET